MHKYPFAVRLAGFDPDERPRLANALAKAPGDGPGYFCLLDDSLQEPDLVIANSDDLKAMASVMAAPPTALAPVLVIGEAAQEYPYPRLHRPLNLGHLYGMLEELIERRADAQVQLTSRGLPLLTERRRKPRLDLDITDPADYLKLRKEPLRGAVLIVDKSAALRDHLEVLAGPGRLAIEWTDSAVAAQRLCDETPVALVLINTSTPLIDPYGLTASIKAQRGGGRIAVVLLVGANFHYHAVRAKAAGVRGLLDKPVADRHLIALLKRLLSLPP